MHMWHKIIILMLLFLMIQRIPRYFDPGETLLETCFNCGEEGHVAVNCPMEKRKRPCFVCGLFGHNSKQCTQVGLPSSKALLLGDLGMYAHALDKIILFSSPLIT